jgi:hypothetical protein
MKLEYQYSILIPCFCQASRMLQQNIEIQKVKIDNTHGLVAGEVIEKRHELDENNYEHVQTIHHCQVCSPGLNKCK